MGEGPAEDERPRPVPRLCADVPPIRGVFASEPEDFEVQERLAYEPQGRGTHTFLWIEKRRLSTFGAVDLLARRLGRRSRDFGVAGLKDANAVTRQWISIEHADPARLEPLDCGAVRILRVTQHPHKLRLGHGKGNRFKIRIRGVADEDRDAAASILGRLETAGLANAFGSQRMGAGGSTLRLGLTLLRSSAAEVPRRASRRLASLALSAVQSELFNRVLAARLPAIGTLLDGDVALLHRNGAAFRVERAKDAQPRADAREISPAGPLLGTDLLEAAGRPRAIEEEVFAAFRIDAGAFAHLPPRLRLPGARRALRVFLEDLEWEFRGSELRLAFALPAGSYATGVVGELLGTDRAVGDAKAFPPLGMDNSQDGDDPLPIDPL